MKDRTYIKFTFIFVLIILAPVFSLKSQILSDLNNLHISGKKLININFNFSRELKIIVKDNFDLDYISKITLPETHDKTYIFHTSQVKNINQFYSNVLINNYEISGIINGIITPLKFEKSESKHKSVIIEEEKFGTFIQTEFINKNIQIGDTILLKYSYSIPFEENLGTLTNYRIFFNDILDKKHYELNVSHDNDLLIPISSYYSNSPVKLRNEEQKTTSTIWKVNELKGNINEVNAIPSKTLPHIVVSCVANTFYYLLPNSTQLVPRPLYSIAAFNREAAFLSIIESIKIGNKNNQYAQINKFIKEHTATLKNDSTDIQKLTTLHNKIVTEFNYENDFDYYDEYDNRNERIGDFLSKKTVRDRSRHSLYVSLIKSLEMTYFTGYIVDRRSGELSNEYVAPMFKDDYLIIPMFADKSIRYILPKKDGLSYYMDELPFYYENTKLRLVHIVDYSNRDKPISEKFNSISTPKSSVKDNIRNQSIMIDLNTETGTATFQSKINLSGQFSTLTRFIYESKDMDKTINPLYNITLWDRIKANKTKLKRTKSKSTFPYNTNYDVTFTKQNYLTKKKNDIEISLSGHFHHVMKSDLNEVRTLPYIPDFLSYDLFNYFIKLDKPLTLKNPYSKNIDNKLGKYTVEISQVAPNVIKVSSLLAINHETVAPEDFLDVINISNEIKMLNNYSLKLSE